MDVIRLREISDHYLPFHLLHFVAATTTCYACELFRTTGYEYGNQLNHDCLREVAAFGADRILRDFELAMLEVIEDKGLRDFLDPDRLSYIIRQTYRLWYPSRHYYRQLPRE